MSPVPGGYGGSGVGTGEFISEHNSGPNLLLDGSYEKDASWWAQEISPVDTHNTLSSTHAYSGTQSMKWTGATTHYPNVTAAGQAGSDASYGFVKTETGRVYRVSFWVYRDAANTSGGYVRALINLAGVGGNDLVNGTQVNQSTITVGTWTHYTSTFTVPATGTHAPYSGVAPAITIQSVDSADQFWVDNARFDDLTDAPVGLLAPPPTGDRTTDSANLQALSDIAQTLGRGTVVLRAGTYAADVVTQALAVQPRFVGQGKDHTQWDGTLKFQGHGFSDKFSGGFFGKLKFVGSHAGSKAVELNACADVHWDEVRFEGTFDVGIWFHNELSGDYTEMCNGYADFATAVTTALEYTAPNAGWGSFHWSGLTGGTIQHGAGPAVLIDTLARPYNAPLTVGVWSSSSTYPVIQHNGDAQANFHGDLTVEQSAVAALGAGTALPYSGTVSAYMGPGLTLSPGTLYRPAVGVQAVSGGTLTPLPFNIAKSGQLNVYNTADQVTNTEYGQLAWASNVLTLTVGKAGTGTQRGFTFVGGAGQLIVAAAPAGPSAGSFQFFSSTATVGACTVGITGTGSASSGVQYGQSISTIYNQSGTAGYIASFINVTETATGSGAKKLASWQLASVEKFSVDNAGNAYMAGTLDLGNTSDTTIARSGPGAITVEGVQVLLSGAALGTPASGTLTNCTGLPIASLTASTSTALGVGSIELGHATDTTVSRASAGQITVESIPVVLRTIQTVTSTVTLGAVGDFIVFIGASGAPTLPTAVGNTGKYTFKNIHTANRTISTTSSQTIETLTTYTLPANASIDVVSDGANWRVI